LLILKPKNKKISGFGKTLTTYCFNEVVVGKQGKKEGGWGEGIFACLLPAPSQ